MNIILIKDFNDPSFCNAFKMYFNELKIQVKDWKGLFDEMNQTDNLAFLMKKNNETIGFIQFKLDEFTNWFFNEKIGFIREFWIREDYRNHGYGSVLLDECEKYLLRNNIHRILLTADDAIDFYKKKGFQLSEITAVNEMDVLSKFI